MNRQPNLYGRKNLFRDTLDWQKQANCIGEPLSTFFPEGPRQEAETEQRFRDLCAACPVRAECLDYSINQPERYGRWGALNEDERVGERRRRMRRTQPHRQPKPQKQREPRRSAGGAARRVRAATAAGRTLQLYARVSGVPESTLSKVRDGTATTVTVDRYQRIVDAYPVVVGLVDEVHREPLRVAAERGWPLPEEWDGLDIDDPNVHPRQSAAA